ncbi:MAG TPA: peptidoglycan editing factor PgeF [Actinomycetota bacterium]|nr:peptidoglycan editing factor PgeF [Actinomycetota bacterium]
MLERRKLANGVIALVSPTLESDGFLAAFTERERGTSTGAFHSLNLGLRTGDDPERVAANRSRVCEALAVSQFACGRQVHGSNLERVGPERAGAGFADPSSAFDATDALITSEAGTALAVLTADCFPVALGDPRNGTIAVVHAGWRGVAAGIIGKAVAAFDDPPSVKASVGPGISVDHYEVRGDVVAAVTAGAETDAVVRTNAGRVHLDLGATLERSLRVRGVRHIETAGLCTACEQDRFFSYRRDGLTGRQSLIALRMS